MAYYKYGAEIRQDISNSDNIFKNEGRDNGYAVEEVRKYLSEVVTGVSFPLGEPEKMYVSYEKLQQMVDEGYNIVSVLNPEDLSPYKIYIEYQKNVIENNNKHGR